jgi:dihydrofolate reductase
MSIDERPAPPDMPTPPSTILDDNESPTTSDPNTPAMTMIGNQVRRPLYLIVATAVEPPMGIGHKGGLPWANGLKSDMAFFRRVTRQRGSRIGKELEGGDNADPGGRNAVVMGRKTWESIPRKFRPLAGRLNVVVTRNAEKFRVGFEDSSEEKEDQVLIVSSLMEGLTLLRGLRQVDDASSMQDRDIGNDFIIGGSNIYRAALEISHSPFPTHGDHGKLRGEEDENESLIIRILQTQVRRIDGKAFECDTFFPLDLTKGDAGKTLQGWREADKAETESWIGEELPQKEGDWTTDGGGECEIRVVGWEKIS